MQCEMARQFFDMLTVITAKQKIPKEYADGQVLYNAEIELLEKIYQYPQANISILSVKLGVTKSAVTQMSIKLLDKGLIEKFQDSKNKKEKYLYRQTIRQGFQSPQLSTIIGETEKRRFAVCKIHRQARQEL